MYEIEYHLKKYEVSKRSIGLSDETIGRIIRDVKMYARQNQISDVRDITTDSVVEWGERKLTAGLVKHSTLATYYNSIRAFTRHLIVSGIEIDIDPDQVRCRARYKEKKILKPGQIRRTIKHADKQTQVLIRLMFNTGMRISEAVSIGAEHLTDDVVIYVTGKGSKSRPVVITQELLVELKAMAHMHSGPCFIDQYGNRLSRKKAYYYIKKAMTSAGYGWAHPHILRHSYCTDLLRRGVDLTRVSKMMGHSSVTVTQVYTHLVTDDIVKAHRLLSRV